MKTPQPEDLKQAALELARWEHRAKVDSDRTQEKFQADIRVAHEACRQLAAKLTRQNILTQNQCLNIISKAKLQVEEEARVEAAMSSQSRPTMAEVFAARRARLGMPQPT